MAQKVRKVGINIYVVPIKRDSAFDQSIVELWQSRLNQQFMILKKFQTSGCLMPWGYKWKSPVIC